MTDKNSPFSAFKPRSKPRTVSAEQEAQAERTAESHGFVAQLHGKPVDGRKLRATNNKAQLNLRVNDATKERFMAVAAGYRNGNDALTALLDLWEREGG